MSEGVRLILTRRRIQRAKVTFEVVDASVQRDVEDGHQATNAVWEAADSIFEGLGGSADFSMEPMRGYRFEGIRIRAM